ncbi:hypothetical protein ACJZ2D_007380 [Fusarium nematophilum]
MMRLQARHSEDPIPVGGRIPDKSKATSNRLWLSGLSCPVSEEPDISKLIEKQQRGITTLALLDSGHNIFLFCSANDQGKTKDRSYPGQFSRGSRGALCKIGAATATGGEYHYVSLGDVDFLFPGHVVEQEQDEDAGDSATAAVLKDRGTEGSSLATAFTSGLSGLILYILQLVSLYYESDENELSGGVALHYEVVKRKPMVRTLPWRNHSSFSKFDDLVNSGEALYDVNQEHIEHINGDLKFQFLLTSALSKKSSLQTHRPNGEEDVQLSHQRRDGSDISTEGFEIGNIGSTHVLVATKFCFARPHLMLLTLDGHRRHLGKDYVAFYNCGQDRGCSRLHKHLQVMVLPGGSFGAFLDSADAEEPNVLFQWFHRRFESQHPTPETLTMVYTDLLKQVTEVGKGRSEHAHNAPAGAACPHNVILTNLWMLVIPRRRACINKEAGVNAIGMLGVIAVATQNEVHNWVRLGLTESLGELGVSK